jgi:O-antigen/teichoic acid export membrane protein
VSDWKHKYTSDESAKTVARVVVTILLAFGLGLACWIWPTGFTDPAHGDVPLGSLLWAIGSVLVALLTIMMVVRAWRDL